MRERDADLLARAAERAADRPFFLGAPLRAVAESEALDDAALAARLACSVADLPALRLCRRPAGEAAAFRADTQRIADRFHLDAARLAEVVRLADALAVLGKAAAPGLLAAARDREPEEEPRQ